MPFSGQVMLATVDGGATSDSFAQLDTPSNPDESYSEFDIYFPQASLDAWVAGVYSPDFFDLLDLGLTYNQGCWLQYIGGTWRWAVGNGTPVGPVLGDTVYRIRVSSDINAQTVVLNVDGSDLVTSTDTLQTLGGVALGLLFATVPATAYFDNVTVSALAPGGSELLDADFETAIVPPFTSITGDVALADSPEGAVGPDVRDPFGLGRFYEAPPWRFVVTDLDGVIVTWLDHLAFQRSITFTRGQPTVIDTGVPSDNPEINIDADDGDPFVSEGNRLVYCFRRDGGAVPWHIWASGLAMNVHDNANSDVAITTLTAYDSRQLLGRRPVLKDATGVLPDDQNGLTYINQSAAEILVEQLDLMEFWETGPLPSAGLDWGQTYFYEGTIETTPDILEITFPRGTSIGEMIGKLEETGTCDVVIRAIWDPINRPGILGELSIYERAGSQRNAAVFGYDSFPKNLVGMDRLVDGRERANEIQFYAGQGGVIVTPYQDAASEAKYGHYFAQQFFPGQISVPAVEAMAQRTLTLQKNGQKTYALSPAAERAPIPLTEYRVFDDVPVYASRTFRDPVATTLRVESIPIIIGDDQLERVSGLLVAVDPTVGYEGAAPDAPGGPDEAYYTIPGGATVVTTQAELDTALAVGTPTDIKVMNGTYTKAGPVTPAAAHRIWCESATGVTFNYGWDWQYKSNWEMHGGVYTLVDTAHAALDTSRAVILNWFGTPANASGAVITDVTLDGNRAFQYGIRLGCPHGATVERVTATNFLDVAVRLSDNTPTSTAVITAVTDLDLSNIYRTTRGDADGTAEAGLWVGHKVTGGVDRIKVRNTGWMGIIPINKCEDTTFSHLDIDEIYGNTPATGDPTGTGIYVERVTDGLVFEYLDIGPDVFVGINGEWDNGTPGNAAMNNTEIRYGTINCNLTGVYAAGPLLGQPYHRVGVYADEGSRNVLVHNVTFLNQNWACVGRYLNSGLPSLYANDYSGRNGGAVAETTSHISDPTP